MPGGTLVIQVPNRSVMARIVRETAPSETLGPGYAGTEAYEYDPETNRMHGAGAWQVGGETQFWNFSLRLYTLAELKKLAAKEGLSVTGTFEDYLGEPFDARTSSEMIVVFKRRD
jgi:hypothetical protein